MAERKLLVDEDEINYEGLFEMSELYALIDDYIKIKGYDKCEPKNEEAVYPEGKTIHLLLTPNKLHTDYVQKTLKIELQVSELKDVETEVDKVKVSVNQGKIRIKLSAFLDTDWAGRWEQKPMYAFLRVIFNKFIYKGEVGHFEHEIVSDLNELKAQIGAYLNLNRFRKAS